MLKKKIAALLMAGVLAGSSISAFAAAEPTIYVTVDGLMQKFDTQPVLVDGVTMMEIHELADMIGATLTYAEGSDTAKFLLNKRTLVVTEGTTATVVNYKDGNMQAAPVMVDGMLYVPLKYVASTFLYNVGWDATTNTVKLDSTAKDYSVLDSRVDNIPPEDAVTLTFNDALNIIISKDSTLVDLKANYTLLQRNYDDLDREVSNARLRLELGSKNVYTWDEVTLLQNRRSAYNSLMNARASQTLQEQADEKKLRSAIDTINTADLNLYLAYKQLELSEIELANAKVKYNLGLESQATITATENTIERTKLTIAQTETTQEQNRRKLAEMLYYDAGTYIVISDYNNSSFSLPDDLESYISSMHNNSPSLVSLQSTLDNAKYVYTTYTDLLLDELKYDEYRTTGDASEVLAMKNNITSAQQALTDSQSSLESTIRNSYSSINQLEQSYASAQLEWENAVATYKNTVTNYVTGYATIYDVMKAEMNILSVEITMQTNRDNYYLAVYAFQYPYM